MPVAAPTPDGSIIRSTLRALLVWKRFAPILLVSAALLGAQGNFSRDPLALPLGAVMCALFVLIAPVSFRVLFPDGIELSHGAIRVLLYGAIATGVVSAVGVMAPRALGMGRTLLTAPSSVLVCIALFVVGGWGLGRDIGWEARVQRAERKASAAAREAERAQLLALRAHLDPHFLFNTLNAIAEWCRTDGETAERAVLELAKMLRTVLAGVRTAAWPLADELALLGTLFDLHRMRDPDLFVFRDEITAALPPLAVPPMLLMPLAENAVKHGPAKGHRGPVVLSARIDAAAGELHICLSNPGPYGGPRAGGEGVAMVERRLALAYDGRARLRMSGSEGHTIADVTLPLEGGPSEAAT